MSTYTQILYQIILGTWNHENTIFSDCREELYNYIGGILRNKKCHLYCIGGTSNHIHIVTHLHPSTYLASLVKDIKLASTEFFKKKNIKSEFSGWQKGYSAFTYSQKE